MPNSLHVAEQVLSSEQVIQVLDCISQLEEARWIKRTYLDPGRGLAGESCCYDYCGHRQLPKWMQQFFIKMAPIYKDCYLDEVAINRYNKGDFIGKHQDRHAFRRNVVISLQQAGDGVYVDQEERFIEDKIGQAVEITGIGPVHSVPPVKNLRYSLIYLYG